MNISRGERRKLRMSLGSRTNRRNGVKTKVIKRVSPGKPCPKSRYPNSASANNMPRPAKRLRGLIHRYLAGEVDVNGQRPKGDAS